MIPFTRRPPGPRARRRAASLPALGVLLGAACAAPRPAILEVPDLETGVRHYPGTVLTGRQPDPEAAERVDAGDAFDVQARVTYLEAMPDNELPTLATRTRLIVSARGDETLLPSARLAIGARIGAGAGGRQLVQAARGLGPERAREIVALRGVLPEGVTVSLHARSVQPIFREGLGEVRRLLGVLISREERDGLTAALAIESQDPELPPEANRRVVERQIVLLEDAPRLDGDPLVIAVPSPFDPFGRATFLIEVTVRRAGGDAGYRDAVARCLQDLREEGTTARDAAAGPDLRELQMRTLAGAVQALDLAEHHRAAVVFLTGTNRAPLALDLALAADETTLAAYLQTFMRETGGAPMTGGMAGEALAWAMDRVAWQFLVGRLRSDALPVGLRGMLVRHAGAAGRFPLEIQDALAGSGSREAFEAALVEQNRDFLFSPDPASRVRAFDWLQARGQAPADYDPLGSREARREALDRDLAARRRGGGT